MTWNNTNANMKAHTRGHACTCTAAYFRVDAAIIESECAVNPLGF